MTQADRTDDLLLSKHRHCYNATNSPRPNVRKSVRASLMQLGSLFHVGDPDEPSTPDGSAGCVACGHRPLPLLPPVLELFRRVPIVGDRVDERPVEAIDASMRGAAQSDGIADDRIEYGLHVSLRLTDYTQDLTRRSLLLERLGHLRMGRGQGTILLLQLGEQAHVLDRDDGLVGEGSEQRDLLVCEGADLHAPDQDRADGDPLTE